MATYKPASFDDINLLVEMMQDFYAIDGYPIDVEQSKILFSTFISNENLGKVWLIQSENQTIGYLILTFIFSFEYGGTIGFVDELYLSEQARGKGIGKESIAFAQAEAAKLSLKLLYLEVEPHNATAQKLYLAAGFSQHKRELMRFKTK